MFAIETCYFKDITNILLYLTIYVPIINHLEPYRASYALIFSRIVRIQLFQDISYVFLIRYARFLSACSKFFHGCAKQQQQRCF